MREIKCRVYSKEKKKLVCCYQEGLIFHLDTGQIYSVSGMNVTDKYLLYQYTGLKDKNGVEIYEGDVVIDHVGTGVVKYSDKNGAFRVVYGDGMAKWFYDYILNGERESIEVIGNIYENPELLETKE